MTRGPRDICERLLKVPVKGNCGKATILSGGLNYLQLYHCLASLAMGWLVLFLTRLSLYSWPPVLRPLFLCRIIMKRLG